MEVYTPLVLLSGDCWQNSPSAFPFRHFPPLLLVAALHWSSVIHHSSYALKCGFKPTENVVRLSLMYFAIGIHINSLIPRIIVLFPITEYCEILLVNLYRSKYDDRLNNNNIVSTITAQRFQQRLNYCLRETNYNFVLHSIYRIHNKYSSDSTSKIWYSILFPNLFFLLYDNNAVVSYVIGLRVY